MISRGLEEVEWWSAYKLGNGEHLFDSYVPVASSLVGRETSVMRYAGLEVPPDDTSDARLKAPNVVGVLTYASGERVIREALITCDNAKRAELLRSFADATRTLSFNGQSIRLSIAPSEPPTATAVIISIPVNQDGLDLIHVQIPAGLHVTAWKR